MNAVYEGKTVQEWIGLLHSANVAKRCAAALAMAEFDPNTSPARGALLPSLNDTDIPVQVAVQIAIGFIHVPVENRRRMLGGLIGCDDYERHSIVASLLDLANSGLLGTASVPNEEHISPLAIAPSIPATPAPTPLAPLAPDDTDIAVVTVVPWWLVLGGTALCLGLAWLLRGLWWPKWASMAIGAVAAALLLYAWQQRQSKKISLRRFRARARFAGSVIVATALGFGIGLWFPSGGVLIDNASGANVRLLLDGTEWVTIQTGESKKRTLTQGKYRLTVQAADGPRILDEHEIHIEDYGTNVLNVLGGQIYFQGTMQYGVQGGGADMKLVTAKWFPLPKVDYLFRDMPAAIHSVNPVNKTFFTKGAPPKFNAAH